MLVSKDIDSLPLTSISVGQRPCMNQLELPKANNSEETQHPAEMHTDGCSPYKLTLQNRQRNDPRYEPLG